MFDTQHSKQSETDRSQAAPAQEPSRTKRNIHPIGDLTRIPLYTQLAWGNQPPPWLRPDIPQQTPLEGDPLQRATEPTQRKENTTGLPDTLKAAVEKLSGLSMDDVQVHYNSSKPAEIQALAYTRGTEIHIGPGQEQHLAHEAWHVVQQKRGRVEPTLRAKGVAINNDEGLEKEADVMGARVEQMTDGRSDSMPHTASPMRSMVLPAIGQGLVIQRGYDPTAIQKIELKQSSEKWVSVIGEQGREDALSWLTTWCDTYRQANLIIQNCSAQEFLNLKNVATTNLGLKPKDIATTPAKINQYKQPGAAGPVKTPDEIYTDNPSYDTLQQLYLQNKISKGTFIGNAYRTTLDINGGFSVATSITGMNQYVVHIHCKADGFTASGSNPAHIKHRKDMFIVATGVFFPKGDVRNALVPGPEDRLAHFTAHPPG